MNRLWAPWRMTYLMSEKPDGCIFCDKPGAGDDEANYIVFRGAHSFAMLNAYPYNNGHLLIAPFRHVDSFSGLTDEERCDLMSAVARAESLLEKAMSPQGMNVGANLGHCAGAGVPGHVHVHIVPRWEGDTNFMPVVGETRVLPESLSETYRKLRECLT
ncbi:MAG: HIT domain-containing protein [Candidatus Eisenbacteria bacterium]|nr:HIT domain-containing protein [Candidatus Eisenbacteria bacterium]